MLTEVADGVWVQQSEWVWTNSIVVGGDDGLIIVDPGISGAELNELRSGPGASPVDGGSERVWHPS